MRHPSAILNSIIFGWYIPMWMLMGAIPTALLGLKFRGITAIPQPPQDHLQSLIDANHELWDELFNHPFPLQMARGTAPLNGFRHYMIQDARYLEFYARVRMMSIASSTSGASPDEIDTFVAKMANGFRYAAEMRKVCGSKLGVPEDVVVNEPMSQQLKDSIQFYERIAREGDWLDMHIALLPCIMGYYMISTKLLLDPGTVRNTPYYTLWIQENANACSFDRYKKIINEQISKFPNGKKWPYWNSIFAQACRVERAFFDLAYEDFKYDIIRDGRYRIRNFGKNGVYLVPSSNGSVVALENAPDEDSTWELTNERDGYSIQNVASGTFLGVSVTERFPPFYDVNSEGEGHSSWALNPISFSERRLYQLFVSSKLQFTLDADVSQSGSRVFVTNNHMGSSQMWILEAVV